MSKMRKNGIFGVAHRVAGNLVMSNRSEGDDPVTKRLDLADLRPELRVPAARPFLLAFLALVDEQVRLVAAYRAHGAEAMSLLDLAICQHILAFEIVEGGTRQQPIVDSLDAPRRTIRNGLARLEAAGLVVRDEAGLYHPTKATAEMVNANFERNFRLMARMCEAFAAYRAAPKIGP